MNDGKILGNSAIVVKQSRTNHAICHTPLLQFGDIVGFNAPINLDVNISASILDLLIWRPSKFSDLFFTCDKRRSPKPRFTLMTRTRSTACKISRAGSIGVAGFSHHANSASTFSNCRNKSVLNVSYCLHMDGKMIAPCIDILLICCFCIFLIIRCASKKGSGPSV